jgi:hypothetical protein
MKYEIPPSIKIKGKKIEILWSDDLDPQGSNNLTYGEWRPNENQIILRKSDDEIEVFKTLLHEITHAVSDIYKLNLTHASINKYETVIYRIIVALGLVSFKKEKKKRNARKV